MMFALREKKEDNVCIKHPFFLLKIALNIKYTIFFFDNLIIGWENLKLGWFIKHAT